MYIVIGGISSSVEMADTTPLLSSEESSPAPEDFLTNVIFFHGKVSGFVFCYIVHTRKYVHVHMYTACCTYVYVYVMIHVQTVVYVKCSVHTTFNQGTSSTEVTKCTCEQEQDIHVYTCSLSE